MAKPSDPQHELQDALAKQRQNTQGLDRTLWIILPIFAILLSTIFANWNILSTLGTAIVLTTAFVMVGIKKKSLAATLILTIVYCFIDNYLSYDFRIDITGLKRQLLSMILFIAIIGLARPMAERSLMKQNK